MAQSLDHSLDETDLQVIGLLQQDGRRSNSDVARQLGLPESTVRRRIERLLRERVVEIVAVADNRKLGLPVHVVMGLSVDLACGRDVVAAVAALPEARWVAATTGPYDIMLEAYFHDTAHLHSFITERLACIRGIERVASAIVLDLAKHTYDWRALMAASLGDVEKAAAAPLSTVTNSD